jgi:FlaG/FlaF family flagellin (archaellin)
MLLYWENLIEVNVVNMVVGTIALVAIVLSLAGAVFEEVAMRRAVGSSGLTRIGASDQTRIEQWK